MTPTPDPPPADPLTAEQIADEWLRLAREMPTGAVTVERRDRLDTEQGWIYETVLCVAGYPFAKFVDATETAYHASITPQRMIAFMEHHAALRDRLSRAEARCVALQTVCDEVFGAVLRSDWKGRDARKVVLLLEATLRATPTDGAARAGDAEQGASCHHHWHPTSSRPRNTHICCHCGTTRSMIGMPPEYYDRADDCGPCLPGHTP